jgi:hypothetical protein
MYSTVTFFIYYRLLGIHQLKHINHENIKQQSIIKYFNRNKKLYLEQ